MHVLIDIDDCLASARWRGDLEDWDAFHAASVDDKPNAALVAMINALSMAGTGIIAVTGRPEKWRGITQAWLLEHGVLVDELLMRPAGDYRLISLVKLDLARARFGSDDDVRTSVAFVIDDNEHVIQAFRAIGVATLQVFVP